MSYRKVNQTNQNIASINTFSQPVTHLLRRLNRDEIDKRTDREPINEIPEIFCFHKYSIKALFPRQFRDQLRALRSALRHIKFFTFNQFRRAAVKNIGVKCFLPYRRRQERRRQRIYRWRGFKKQRNRGVVPWTRLLSVTSVRRLASPST